MKLRNAVLLLALLAQSLSPVPPRRSSDALTLPERILQQVVQTITNAVSALEEAPQSTTASILSTPVPSKPVAPAIVLSLTTDPQSVKPGEQVTVDWQIKGAEKIEGDAFLRFYVPPDFMLTDLSTAKVDEANQTVDVPVTATSGQMVWEVGLSASLPTWMAVEFWQGGEVLAKGGLELAELKETTIESMGGEAEGLDGQVKVTFPTGALSETVKVKVERPSEKSLPVESLSGSPFEITAISESRGVEVSKFSKPVEIRVHYDESEMNGNEEDLRLYWYNPADGQWKLPLSQQVDTANNVLIATTDHFTVFDMYNSGWQSAETPTMSYFQHSGFTGGASFSMPIKVPAGPGGLQPSLSMSYSSQTVDSVTTESQASWAGMGWSFDAGGYIERNGSGTKVTDDDTYQLSANGMSGTIWPDANGGYHLESENFNKITYNATNDSWVILGKDSTQYYFEESAGYTKTTECPGQQNTVEALTWRWMLKRVVNIYGQTMRYTYARESQVFTSTNNGCTVTHAVTNWIYPDEIVYANDHYRIKFNRIPRYDYKLDWLTAYQSGSYRTFQRSLLSEIRVEQDANGDGTFETLIRKYQLNYCGSATCSIFPAYIWPSLQNYRTPTLVSVQEFGLNGTDSLPPYTFTYGDKMHLTSAQNGYGGEITFTYNNQPDYNLAPHDSWHESIPYETLADGVLEADLPLWGNPVKCHFEDSQCGWAGVGQEGIVGGGQNGYIRIAGLVEKNVQSFQPGRWYRIVAEVKAAGVGNHSLQLGYSYYLNGVKQPDVFFPAVTPNGNLKTIESEPFFLPVDTTKFAPRMNSTGYTDVYWYYLVPLPTYARVSSRTLSAGGTPYTFNYAYQNPATNNPDNSSALSTAHPYSRAYTEFRGYQFVTENDPYGKATITEYGQNDCLSGRTLSTTVKAGSLTLERTTFDYTTPELTDCTEWDSPAILLDQEWPFEDVQYTGLRYRWVRTASETRSVYKDDGVTVDGSTTTAYEYETTYGNQVTKTVSGTDVETVVTHTEFMENTSGGLWLVGLPLRTWTESGGLTLTDSINLYEDPLRPAVLTATRTLIDLSLNRYSQTSMVHDAWGNVTSQTTWSGYGTATSAPTSGERTSYTTYDPTYHTYAVTMTDALGHQTNVAYNYSLGLPVSETDPNGAATSVTYDSFGRFTGLTKPGDATPAMTVSYQNSPFVVTLNQKIDDTHTFTVARHYDGLGRQYLTDTNGVLVNSTFDAYGRAVTQSTPHTEIETAYYTDTTYDPLGRPLTVSDYHLASETNPPILTTTVYNGLTTTVTDAKSHTHTTVTDILGRTLSVTPPTGPEVTFTYDPLGNMRTATRGGATVTMNYDQGGRKTGMDDPDLGLKSQEEQWGWMYDYDALGNMTSQTDNRGCVTTIIYDPLNRPTNKSYSNCPSTPSVTYTYDTGTSNAIGRRVSMGVSGGDFTTWEYDLRGRVTAEHKTIPGGGQFNTSFTYNDADLPKTMTYPGDNEVVTFEYNDNMLVEKVFNDMGTPENLNDDINYAQSIAYDSAMRMIQLVRGANTLNTVFHYNDWNVDSGRLLNLTTTRPSDQAILQNSTYDYDVVGNIQTITDSLLGPQTQTFQYDALDRLTSSNVTGGSDGLYSETYSYDSATGNLASKGGVNYTAYDTNHKHAVTTLSNGNSYGYDANGNMTSRNVNGQSFTLGYDAENRLVSVTGAATATFVYDGDSKQVKSIVNGVTTVYVGNHYEVKNSVVTKYYFAGTTRLAVRTDGTLSYLLGDHIGSSSVTTNENGVKTASALYKAFGETRYTLGNLGTDYKFTGQREEASLGIYFFNARWMDPSLGRFLSPDTIVPTQTQGTQAWDRYAFVNNNPVRYNDPTGHEINCTGSVQSDVCNPSDSPTYSNTPPINCTGPVLSDVCTPEPQADPPDSPQPTSPQPNSCPVWDQNCVDDGPTQKDDDATKEPELTSPDSEVDWGKIALGVGIVLIGTLAIGTIIAGILLSGPAAPLIISELLISSELWMSIVLVWATAYIDYQGFNMIGEGIEGK